MRGLIIGLPLSLVMWAGLIWLFANYGFDAMALLMIAGALIYILGTIRRDWTSIAPEEWEAGETGPFYGREK